MHSWSRSGRLAACTLLGLGCAGGGGVHSQDARVAGDGPSGGTAGQDPADALGHGDPPDGSVRPEARLDAAGGTLAPGDAAPPTAPPDRPDARPPPDDADAAASPPPDGDAGEVLPPPVAGARHPIVFVHGINGSHADFDVMVGRFEADGWPRDWLVALDYPDPAWGCNADNAAFLDRTVEDLRRATGEAHVDVIAHSMGALSSRYYLQRLGGHDIVTRYVTLGGLHHGNGWACLNPLPVCVWQELCPTNPFLADLNGDPDAPGTDVAVCICSTSDETADLETCHSDTMEYVEVDGPGHSGPGGLLEDEPVWQIVRAVMTR